MCCFPGLGWLPTGIGSKRVSALDCQAPQCSVVWGVLPTSLRPSDQRTQGTRHPIRRIVLPSPRTVAECAFVEAAAPRGTKIIKVILSNDGLHEDMVIDIPGGSLASATVVTPTPSEGSSFCPSLLLPPLLLGAAAALGMKR